MKTLVKRVLWCLMVSITASSCEKEYNLPSHYINTFIESDSLKCSTILVIPKYACRECTRFTYSAIKTNKKNFWIITDDESLAGRNNVIIEKNKNRINRYNPYVNKMYLTHFSNGELTDIQPIGINNLDSIEMIFNNYIEICP